MLMGSYSHNFDAKGRVFIPAKFREGLGDNFVVTKGGGKCLYIFSAEEWERLYTKLQKTPSLTNKPLQDFKRMLFANAFECVPDKQGRILLPQALRDYIGIIKEAVIAGVMTRCEIWSKEHWDAYSEETEEDYDTMIGMVSESDLDI